ncbi:hypothetical protein BHM03_00051726 [Ensete ventricosum]|nr:hypothetical protein BHM03_00051726 [Ensete ventricosum]
MMYWFTFWGISSTVMRDARPATRKTEMVVGRSKKLELPTRGGCRASLESRLRNNPTMELSPSSSFDLTNFFYTSSRRRFIECNCAMRESIESEERVSSSGRLGMLVADGDRLVVVSDGPKRSSREGCGPLSSSCCGIGSMDEESTWLGSAHVR